jgi:hypothetical protein
MVRSRPAAKTVMWNMQRALEEQPQPRDREPNKLLTAPTKRGRPVDPAKEERADRRRQMLERRESFERLHAEAGRRLRALREQRAKVRAPGDETLPVR